MVIRFCNGIEQNDHMANYIGIRNPKHNVTFVVKRGKVKIIYVLIIVMRLVRFVVFYVNIVIMF